MSLRDLERKSGVSRSDIGKYEKGEKKPTLMTLVRLSLALKVEITDLFKVYK